jgi:hypothetical protein
VPYDLLRKEGKRAPGTHRIGGWVDPRAGLENVEKLKFFILPGLELRPLYRPVRSVVTIPTEPPLLLNDIG